MVIFSTTMGYSTNSSAYHSSRTSNFSSIVSKIDKEILEKKRKSSEFKKSSRLKGNALVRQLIQRENST